MAELAIILTTRETATWNNGPSKEFCLLYNKILALGLRQRGGYICILGKDEDEDSLYDLPSAEPHPNQYVNDRNQFCCQDCGEELGR